MFNLKTEIGKNQVILLIIPNNEYTEYITDIAKQLAKMYKPICYVSLNRLYDALIASLKNNKIDTNSFCFVDAITLTAQPNFKPPNGCVCVKSPAALTQINLSISKELKENKPSCLLFDSLSTLLIYTKGNVVTEFVHSLVGTLRTTGTVAVFTALKGDTESQLIKNLGMFVDKVISL